MTGRTRTLETAEPDEMSQAFARWRHRFEQLSPGRFRGRVAFVELGGIQLFDTELNQIIRCRGERAPDTYTFAPVLEHNADARWRGRLLRPGMINVNAPGHELDHRTCVDYRLTSLSVSRESLERTTAALTGVDAARLLGGDLAFVVDRSRLDRLQARWRMTLLGLDQAPECAPGETGTDPVDAEELVADLVRTLAAGRIGDPYRTTPTERVRVVREVEAFVRAAVPRPVAIPRLCDLAGVSERTLHYAFMEVTGLSPKAYLKTVLLNEARREIRDSGLERGQIRAIARRFGFRRTGNFAADYRRLFGELPSQTARGRRN